MPALVGYTPNEAGVPTLVQGLRIIGRAAERKSTGFRSGCNPEKVAARAVGSLDANTPILHALEHYNPIGLGVNSHSPDFAVG